MSKHRAIPQGYMTVGEIAKKMDVTIRTLQYYDKEGLLPPSAESKGGLRLYTHKEIVKLHQILSMKRLGFSLEEIKTWMPSQNTPREVSNVILEQAKEIRDKINTLSKVLESLEKLNAQVLQTEKVDWELYADILKMLQDKSELYWAVRHLSDKAFELFCSIDKETTEAALAIQNQLLEKAGELQKMRVPPDSEQGQAFAKDYWDVIMKLTGGDTSLLSEFSEMALEHGDREWKSKEEFISKALDLYLTNSDNNPYQEVEQECEK